MPSPGRSGPWLPALRHGALAGSVASLSSTAALLAAGGELGRPVAPLNAVSHWLWGDGALRRDDPSWRHTAAGALIHHAASIFWAVLHARAWGLRPRAREPGPAFAAAAVTTCVAAAVDLACAPRHLRPGFERRLSRPALTAVYVCFGLGLAAGSLWAARRSRPALSSPGLRGRHPAPR